MPLPRRTAKQNTLDDMANVKQGVPLFGLNNMNSLAKKMHKVVPSTRSARHRQDHNAIHPLASSLKVASYNRIISNLGASIPATAGPAGSHCRATNLQPTMPALTAVRSNKANTTACPPTRFSAAQIQLRTPLNLRHRPSERHQSNFYPRRGHGRSHGAAAAVAQSHPLPPLVRLFPHSAYTIPQAR